jgi:hypothetical protein
MDQPELFLHRHTPCDVFLLPHRPSFDPIIDTPQHVCAQGKSSQGPANGSDILEQNINIREFKYEKIQRS